jgi:hypothetical protein
MMMLVVVVVVVVVLLIMVMVVMVRMTMIAESPKFSHLVKTGLKIISPCALAA